VAEKSLLRKKNPAAEIRHGGEKNRWGGAEHGGRKIFRPEAEHGGTAPPRPVAESAVAIYIPGVAYCNLSEATITAE